MSLESDFPGRFGKSRNFTKGISLACSLFEVVFDMEEAATMIGVSEEGIAICVCEGGAALICCWEIEDLKAAKSKKTNIYHRGYWHSAKTPDRIE